MAPPEYSSEEERIQPLTTKRKKGRTGTKKDPKFRDAWILHQSLNMGAKESSNPFSESEAETESLPLPTPNESGQEDGDLEEIPSEDQPVTAKELSLWGRRLAHALTLTSEANEVLQEDIRQRMKTQQREAQFREETSRQIQELEKTIQYFRETTRERPRSRAKARRRLPYQKPTPAYKHAIPVWQPGQDPTISTTPGNSQSGLQKEKDSMTQQYYGSSLADTSPTFRKSTYGFQHNHQAQKSSKNWRGDDNSSSRNYAARAHGSKGLMFSGVFLTLLTLITFSGYVEAASSSETLLFESIGEMVSGLSYSHTIITINLSELEAQIVNYKQTLEKEFNFEHLQGVYLTAMENLKANDTAKDRQIPKFEETVFTQWSKIGAIHMGEVERLTSRVNTLYSALPAAKLSMEDNRRTAQFSPTMSTSSHPEWQAHESTYEKKYKDLFRKPLKRTKRFLPLLGLLPIILGTTGTVFGALGYRDSARVAEQVQAILETQKTQILITEQLVNKTELLENELMGLLIQNALADHFDTSILLARLRTHSSMIETQVLKHEMLIQQLQNQQLAVNFLDEKTLNNLFQQAKKRASSLGFMLLLQRPSDLFQIKVSHFFNGATLSIVLHIPIAPEDSFMRLFKLHPFPLPLANDTFIVPNVRHDVLAVSNTNFRFTAQMSSVDLMGCLKISKLYLCERNGVLHKNPEDSCLGALYHQKFDVAKRICSFTVEPAREYIHQLMDNWFLIHLTEATTVPVLCTNNTHLEWHLKPGVTRQHLGAGCVADFPRHRLLSDLSILIPQDYVQFDMDWDPVSFLPETRDAILPEFQKLKRLGATTVTLSTLQSLVTNRMDAPPFLHHIHFGFNAVAIFTAVILLGLGIHRFTIIRAERIKRRKEKEFKEAVRIAMEKDQLLYEEIKFNGPTLPRCGRFSRQGSMANEQFIEPKANAPKSDDSS